jgi:hypothetical protein
MYNIQRIGATSASNINFSYNLVHGGGFSISGWGPFADDRINNIMGMNYTISYNTFYGIGGLMGLHHGDGHSIHHNVFFGNSGHVDDGRDTARYYHSPAFISKSGSEWPDPFEISESEFTRMKEFNDNCFLMPYTDRMAYLKRFIYPDQSPTGELYFDHETPADAAANFGFETRSIFIQETDPYNVFADPDNSNFTLINEAATQCEGMGVPHFTSPQPPSQVCDDGIIEGTEQCDNASANDIQCTPSYGGTCQWCDSGCNTVTETGPFCGDGNIDAGYEDCDNGTALNNDTCPSTCNTSCMLNTCAPPPVIATGPGDINNDSMVDWLDLRIITGIMFHGIMDARADVNGDGSVDIFDLMNVSIYWGNVYNQAQNTSSPFWQTTFDLPEQTQLSAGNICGGDGFSGDYLKNHGGWVAFDGENIGCSQITSDANHIAGLGGRGFRHRVWDKPNDPDRESANLRLWFADVGQTYLTEMWIRYYIRYEDGFRWTALWPERLPNYDKHMYIRGDASPYACIGWYSNVEGSDAWKGGRAHVAHHGGDLGRAYISTLGWHTLYPVDFVSDGSWICFEAYMKMNTVVDDVGQYDGAVATWINGEPAGRNDAMRFTTDNSTAALGWTSMQISSNQATPENGHIATVDYDDIVIYTTTPPNVDENGHPYIGCI